MNLYAVTLQLFSGKLVYVYMAAPNGGAAANSAAALWGRCIPCGSPRFCGAL